jgi:hypothetical protein
MAFATTPLPLEIILKVFECLLHSKSDLVNISLCSRHFHDLVLPLLYYSFSVASLLRKSLVWDHKKVDLFLRQVRLKPHLARYVKKLDAVIAPFGYMQGGEFSHSVTREEHESVRRWVRDALPIEPFGRDICLQWHRDFFSAKALDAIVAFILVVLPNLQTFEIDFSRGRSPRPSVAEDKNPYEGYIYMVLKHMASQQLYAPQPTEDISLPRLVKVYVGAYQRQTIHLEQVVPFLKLTSLTKLELNRACHDSDFTHTQEQPFNVKDLTLFECHIGPRTARTFFLSFHFLKFFKFKECGIERYEGAVRADGGFTPALVLEGLQNSRHCLEELELLNSDPDWGLGAARSTDPKSFRPLGSLADFTKLS